MSAAMEIIGAKSCEIVIRPGGDAIFIYVDEKELLKISRIDKLDLEDQRPYQKVYTSEK